MNYLTKKFDWENPETASLIDELSLWSSYFTKLLLDNIEMKPNERILDVAFGCGVPILELAMRLGDSCHITGLDIWKAAMERAQWKKEQYELKNVDLMFGDAAEMPFENESFDKVISNLGINNFENPDAVVKECFRVLKKGGKLVLTTNLVGHFREFYSIYESVLRELKKPELIKALVKQDAHRGTVESTREILESNGFSIPKIVKDHFYWRYLTGTAMLKHSLTVFGFMGGWLSILEGEDEKMIFSKIEEKLNARAEWEGELKMSVPMLYIEGIK